MTQGEALVKGLHAKVVVGDRAYDSNAFLAVVAHGGMAAVVPSRANRRVPRVFDRESYSHRNVIERFFGRIKAYRRVATRYDKTAASYMASFLLAALLLELSGWMR